MELASQFPTREVSPSQKRSSGLLEDDSGILSTG
jgi:hypothetical protein